MIVKCPVCDDKRKITKQKGGLNIYRCNSCCHTFTIIQKRKQESYNEDYFLETHKNWFTNPDYQLFDFIYKRVIGLLGNRKIRLLDVGCGKGDFLKYISKKNPGMELFGIDLVDNRHPTIQFIKGDFLKERIKTKFDIICNLAVIEHVDNPNLFVQKLNSLLKPNGYLFTMTVNNNSLIYRIARLLNKLGLHTAYNRVYNLHHIQHYTNQSLKKLMIVNGFDVLLLRNHNYPINAVDVPWNSFIIEKIQTLIVLLIFLLSTPLKSGMLQTIIYKKDD